MSLAPRVRTLVLVALLTFLAAGSVPLAAESAKDLTTLQTFAYFPPEVLVGAGAEIQDPGEAWDKWMDLLRSFADEAGEAGLEAGMREARRELGFDIRADLLPLFRGEVGFALSLDSLDAVMGLGMNPNPQGAEQTLEGILFVVGVSDSEKLDGLIDRFLAKNDLSREPGGSIGEQEIWRVRLGEEGGRHLFLYGTYHRSRLVLGFSPQALSGAVSRYATGPNLGGDSAFLRVRSHLPSRITSLGYVNLPLLAARVREAGMLRMMASGNEEAARMLEQFTAPEMVPFGMGWSSSRVDEGVMRTSYGPDTLVSRLPLGGGASFPIIAAIAVPNLLNAIERGKGKRTAADLRSAVTAVESYAVDESRYPVQVELGPLAAIAPALEPVYIKELPTRDAWGHEVLYWSDGDTYIVVAPGENGQIDHDLAAYRAMSESASPPEGDDVVFADGRLISRSEQH